MRRWEDERPKYHLFTSELVVVGAAGGDRSAASGRLHVLREVPELPVDEEARTLAVKLIRGGGVSPSVQADALYTAVAAAHRVHYLLTWNFRHIDNAVAKPTIRSICATAGYTSPEVWRNRDAYVERLHHSLDEIVEEKETLRTGVYCCTAAT